MRKAARRRSNYASWSLTAIIGLVTAGLIPTAGNAYTAAGERNFPATLILPQLAPTDAFWGNVSYQPMTATRGQPSTSQTVITGNYSKLITEGLGIQLKGGPTFSNRLDTSSVWGAQNFHLVLQYEAINSQQNEFILSFQVDQELGGTGNQRVGRGSLAQSSTTPGISFGKGLGDLSIGYWRPLAITGFAGYQAAEGARASSAQAGFSIQYSIPYLDSHVADVGPSLLRGMTPLIETRFTAPVRGQGTMLLVAPGFSYSAGRGWEFAVEALIPTTKATGRGVGVIAQFVLQLDFLLNRGAGPKSIFGRPIFSPD